MTDTNYWRPLGAVPPTALTEARLQAHYAAQVVSGLGRTLLEKQSDDSHTNLEWDRRLGALTSRRIDGDQPFSAGLEIAALRLLLLDERDEVIVSASLDGMTVEEACDWLGQGAGARRGEALDGFTPLHYEMPAHPLGEGGRFRFDDASPFSELARWFHNAELLLEEARDRNDGASEVRCWPHHFDIATLIDLGGDRSIGLGLSPGDGYYDEPYFYCSPYPSPDADSLPPLAGPGRWHTHEFISIVAPGSSLLGGRGGEEAARAYVDEALRVSRSLL